MSNLSRRRFETCSGAEQEPQQASGSSLAPAAPGTARRGAGAVWIWGPHSPPALPLPPTAPLPAGFPGTKRWPLRSCIKIRSWSCSGGSNALLSPLACAVGQPALSTPRVLRGIHSNSLRKVFSTDTTYPISEKVVKSGNSNLQPPSLFQRLNLDRKWENGKPPSLIMPIH